MAYNFEYYAPTRVFFGRGEERNVGRYIREYGAKHVMIVYGGSSAKRSGLLDRVKEALGSENIPYSEMGGVIPNPHLDKVYEGIDLGKREGTDFLLALGGVSAMEEFYHSIGMPTNMKELGIDPTDEQIEEMADRCLKACGGPKGSAKKLFKDDMIRIYKMARDQ